MDIFLKRFENNMKIPVPEIPEINKDDFTLNRAQI